MQTVKPLFIFCFCLWVGVANAQSREEFAQVSNTEQREFSKSVQVFPNPAIEYLNVKFEEPVARRTNLILYNIIGSAMEAEKEVVDDYEVRLRVKDLPTGYYLLALKDEQSNQRGTFKFLKR